MSVAFVPDWLRGKAEVNQETIQRLLEENDQLIRCIVEYQNKGRANECVHLFTGFLVIRTTFWLKSTSTCYTEISFIWLPLQMPAQPALQNQWNSLPVGCHEE
ncbi:SS18-like protein 2 isoform X2 [Loxodonta africana]|uniref:SS18-like protein 2 isoform X2 n=1 Tax=Loxodonta africana TaxID=9785 RepID=UPI0030CEB483